MTQFHEIPFSEKADSSYLRIELHEGEEPTPGELILIYVFSPSPYQLYLSCKGSTRRAATLHPVPGSGQAAYVFSDSESVSNWPDELEGEQIGTPPHTVLQPAFDGDSLDISQESPAALYNYQTVTFADLVELTIDEDVAEFLITGKNDDGQIASLSVRYPVSTPEDPWNVCSNFSFSIDEPATIKPGDNVKFRTYGPVPTSVSSFSGDTAKKLVSLIEPHEERAPFVEGWADVLHPIWDDRPDKRYPIKDLSSGGVLISVPIDEFPVTAGNALIQDIGAHSMEPFAAWEANAKKVFVQKFEDLGTKGNGLPVDISYKTLATIWEITVPATWYSEEFPLSIKFTACEDREQILPVEVIGDAPPAAIMVTWLDRDTQEPVEGGSVSLGIDGGAYEFKGLTDELGKLTIPEVPAGTHKILMVKDGYKRTDEDSLGNNDWITVE